MTWAVDLKPTLSAMIVISDTKAQVSSSLPGVSSKEKQLGHRYFLTPRLTTKMQRKSRRAPSITYRVADQLTVVRSP